MYRIGLSLVQIAVVIAIGSAPRADVGVDPGPDASDVKVPDGTQPRAP
jgi:hypothetical protein